MACFYEGSYQVDSRAADHRNQCRPSALLGYLQEAAVMASVELGIDRDRMIEKYNLIWMLARIWYRLEEPIRWMDTLTIQTWHRGGKGAAMYRDFDIYRDGQRIGEAVSVWVLADAESHKLARLSRVGELAASDGGALCKDITLSKLRIPQNLVPVEKRRLHYSDADVNAHVNNVRYADFLCDALGLEKLGESDFIRQLQIGYVAECRPGEALLLSAGQEGERAYVHGADEAGRPRFDGFLQIGQIST